MKQVSTIKMDWIHIIKLITKPYLKKWRALANQGIADAQFNSILTYFKGLGVLQDYKEAFKWHQKSAN